MAAYNYRAKDGPTKVVEGRIEAETEKEAIEKIIRMGYIPIRMEELAGLSQAQGAPIVRKTSGRIKSREITVFSRQLASLLKSGVPILDGINIIQEQSSSAAMKGMLTDIYGSIKDGMNLSSTLERYPRIFPPIFIAMIRTGEDSGALPEVLLRISDYRVKQEDMRSRFRMALAYPALMTLVGAGTIFFMLTFVMPRLMGIFNTMGQELPVPTRILISISEFLRQWWHATIVGLALAIVLIGQELKTRPGRIALSAFQLHVPVLGNLVLKANLARFSRTLELLIKSGVSILKAIDISIPVLDNEIIIKQLKESCKDLEQGGSFGQSLKNSKLLPLFMTNLIIVGEESGKLDDSLSEIAGFYERDTDEAIRVFASLLEPVIILVMGLVVGFIVVAMLLPIFEINVMVR